MFNTKIGRNEVKGQWKTGKNSKLKKITKSNISIIILNLNSLSKTISAEIIIFDFWNNAALYRKVKIPIPEYLLQRN